MVFTGGRVDWTLNSRLMSLPGAGWVTAWGGRGRLALPCLLGCVVGAAAARPVRHAVVLTAWELAERRREAFEKQPEDAKTRAGFAHVLDEFRAIYHDDPGAAHAPEAVNAVAELLAEQGRAFHDEKSLRAAVGQYEFLRVQYPTSSLRASALLAEARIDEEDLRDVQGARTRYAALVKEAPRSAAAAKARTALAELRRGTAAQATPHGDLARTEARGASHEEVTGSTASLPKRNEKEVLLLNERGTDEAQARRASASDAPERVGVQRGGVSTDSAAPNGVSRATPIAAAVPTRKGPLAQVTGIRHWSTATYTRVAIDLGDEVTFEAARVPHPDRIFFDLHGARLAQELIGKSFDVTDDGFLKKIRAAQSPGDVTRVVLDVNDVTDYSAFLLPNPYRLIIDIHGGAKKGETMQGATPARDHLEGPRENEPGGTTGPAANESAVELPVAPTASRRASAAANVSGLPATAPTDGGDAVRPTLSAGGRGASELPPLPKEGEKTGHAGAAPAPRTGVLARSTASRPVPNTIAVKAPATTVEVAAVSDSPGKVEATSAPTSKPIVSVLAPGRGGNAALGRHRNKALAATPPVGDAAAPARAADKTADGETSLVRALGLRIGRIVIDAGHGGHDSGTLGVDGIQEKDVVLDVALRLGKLLHERLGAEIIYTRSDDTFIPLETRTAIANKAQADLFLSIHANSSEDETARGVETYYLNFTSDATALDVAARENAVSGQSIHQLSDLVKKITLKDKIAESREFASDVEGSLYSGLQRGNAGLKNRGVKKAPFVVLIGANMPSVLAEISFVTNAKDAVQLRQPEYRERVAESLFTGVAKYENGLAGTREPAPATRASVQEPRASVREQRASVP